MHIICLSFYVCIYISKPITYTIPASQPANQPAQPANQPASQPANQPASQPSQPTSQPASPTSQPANQPASPTQPAQPNHHPPSQPDYKVRGSVSYLTKVPIIGGCRRERGNSQKYRVLPLFLRQQATVNLDEKCKFGIQNAILLQRGCEEQIAASV